MRVLPRGWDLDVEVAAQPEDDGGERHQDPWDPERHRRTPDAQGLGDQERGEEGAQVDAPVEHREDLVHEVLVLLGELVTHQRGDTGLDAARPQGDQGEAGIEAGRGIVEDRQAGMSGAVEQRDVENGLVLPQEAVGEEASEKRGEVDAENEEVEDRLGPRLALRLAWDLVPEEPVDQEHGEDVPHPVEAEPLAGLVSDDERDLRGQPGRARWTGHRQFLARSARRVEAAPLEGAVKTPFRPARADLACARLESSRGSYRWPTRSVAWTTSTSKCRTSRAKACACSR